MSTDSSTIGPTGTPPVAAPRVGGPDQQGSFVGDLLDVITRLAAGELHARVPLSEHRVDDELTALGVGVNMLAEELQVLRDGLEQAVLERTRELHATEEQLRYDAQHDDLTGLGNRRLLHHRIEHLLVRSHEGSALLLLDLDAFKQINDNLGHRIGDAVLIQATQRLTACLRPGDSVARLGGDEFAALCKDVDADRLRSVCDQILAALREPMTVEGLRVQVTASIGVAPVEHARDAEDLLRLAAAAMYSAKGDGGDRACTHSDELRDQARQRHAIEQGLRAVLEDGGLGLAYQPQVDARTGQLLGVEALARWPQTDGPSYPPVLFIPVAEQAGLIRRLGAGVLHRACTDAAQWAATTGQVLRFSVNVSGQQLTDPGFADLVLGTLARSGATTDMLGLEVTESLLVHHQESVSALTRLRSAGVRIAIDDFGTGYSSLSALRRLPIDTLKIDRSFVAGLGSDDDDGTIVRAILALARGLHLDVVAEGVETAAQRQSLAAQGCQALQGYLFARPMPYDALLDWRPIASPAAWGRR